MEFKIKQARSIAGYSQKELASVIGVAPSTLNGYENGTHDPKSYLLCKIAEACSVSVDFLLGRPENNSEKEKALPDLGKAETILLESFSLLNDEGQEKLIDFADDLVKSGKYIKSYTLSVGEK